MAFTQVIKTLGSVMASMKTAVDSWLSQNITNPSNPPLDRSLSLSNACAPADMVGDLKNAIKDTTGMIVYTKTIGGFDSDNGGKTYYDSTNRIRVNEFIGIDDIVSASQPSGYWLYYWVYDASYNVLNTPSWRTSTTPLLFANIKTEYPSVAYVHLMMRKSGNGNMSESDKEKLVITQKTIKNDLSELEAEVNADRISADTHHGMDVGMMTNMFRYLANTIGADESGSFKIGGISDSGYPNDDITTQIRSNDTNLRDVTEFVHCTLTDEWKYDIVFYQSSTPLGIVLFEQIGKSMVSGTNDLLICPKMIAVTAGYTTATKYRLRIKKGDGTEQMTSSDVTTVTNNFVFTPYGKELKYANYYPNVQKALTFNEPAQVQNIASVNGKIWQSTGGQDDHSTYGSIFVIDPAELTGKEVYDGTSENITILYHNFGHSGITDYSDRLDLGLSYGEFDGALNIIFIKNMKDKQGELNVFTDPDISRIPIDNGSYTPFFGGAYNTIMIIVNSAIKTYLLGLGDNDLSSGGYGTFISGCADEEFNGTMKLLKTEPFENMTERTQQQAKLINGAIYMLTGYRDNIIYKYLYAGPGGGWQKRERLLCYNYDDDGAITYEEPEGICVINHDIYYSTWFKDSPKHFHLYEISLT